MTATTAATKTKRKHLEYVYAPQEIRENTKARRAWLEATAARINLEPNRQAVVSKTGGTLQAVSVYEVTTTEGRLRHRGTCQFCGNSQVVDPGTGLVVLHGYKRPGVGYTIGKCPGQNRAPLNVEKDYTEACHAESVKAHDVATADKIKADARVAASYNLAWRARALDIQHDAAHDEWVTRASRDHLAGLLASGIHGTPLTEEVVA